MGMEMKDHQCVEEMIKKTWSALSNDDVVLYESQPDRFYEKLHEKAGLSKEDAEKKIHEFENSCAKKH